MTSIHVSTGFYALSEKSNYYSVSVPSPRRAAALEWDIAHTDYIQAMQTMIHQNSVRMDCLEYSFAVFQQAVAKSMYDLLPQNLISVNELVNDTQTALNNFKATLAYKRKVERLDAVSFRQS